MDQESISEPEPAPTPAAAATAALSVSAEPVAQTSPTPSLRSSNRHAKRALRNSRVHFDEDGFLPVEENPVIVKIIGEELSRTVEVYLGFLQEEHKYEVHFGIPSCQDFLCPGSVSDENPTVEVEVHKQPTTCIIQKIEWSKTTSSLNGMSQPSRLMISLELLISSHSMPIFEDKFTLRSNSSMAKDRLLHVNVAAKIMGKHMGTPSLKDGIKCIGHCPAQVDSDSDAEQDLRKESDTATAT